MLHIDHKRAKCSIPYDDPIVEFSVKLPSGRTLFLCDMHEWEWDTEAQTAAKIAERKAELASMIDELRMMHMSDCATNNAPAYPAGACDCKQQ